MLCQERKCADAKPRCAKEQLVMFSVVCKTKDQLCGQALRVLRGLGPGDASGPTFPIFHQKKPHVPSLKESWVLSTMNNSSFLILPLCMTSPSPILCLERSFFFSFLISFLAAVGLHCCAWAFSSCGERGLFFFMVCRLLIIMPSLVAEHRL